MALYQCVCVCVLYFWYNLLIGDYIRSQKVLRRFDDNKDGGFLLPLTRYCLQRR